MTEHDRGAYTPQPDAPLQFDARSAPRRKPLPMTLIGSAAVLVVLLGALALHARHDAKVGAPIAGMKAAAPATAQPKDAAAVDVFGGAAQTAPNTAPNTAQNTDLNTAQNTVRTPGRAPTFAPPPETPRPRDQLTVQTAEALPTKAALPTSNAPAATTVAKASAPPIKTAPAYHAPGATSPRPDATDVVARLAETPAGRSAPAPTLRAAASVFDGPVVQIGAFSSMILSEKGWTDVSSAMVGEMSGKLKKVEAVQKDGKIFYRTSVAGFPSRSAAEAFCRSLTAKGRVCFTKG